MRLIKITFFTGLFVIVIPLSGLPLSWKYWLVIALGVILMAVSAFEYLELLKKHEDDGQKRFDFEHLGKNIETKARKLPVKSDDAEEL